MVGAVSGSAGRAAAPDWRAAAALAATARGEPAVDPARPVVLQVVGALAGGAPVRNAVALAAAVVAGGGSAIVAAPGGPGVRDLNRLGVRHAELALTRRSLFGRSPASDLVQLIGRYDADLVHAHGVTAAIAREAARRTGRPLVTTYDPAAARPGWRGQRHNAAMVAGARVVVESEFAVDELRRTYAAAADRIRLIPRGVDVAWFDPGRVGAERLLRLAEAWRLPDGMPVVMLPGPLDRRRGHRQLVEAMARLPGRGLRALLVGDGARADGYRGELTGLIARAGLEDWVHVVDDCRDLPAAYMLADVVALPALAAPHFDRAFAEAQAMGRPVVASDHGSVREQAAAGTMVWLTPPGDVPALAGAIAAALDLSPAEREALAPLARTGVAVRYSRDAAAQRMLALYRELLDSRAAPLA